MENLTDLTFTTTTSDTISDNIPSSVWIDARYLDGTIQDKVWVDNTFEYDASRRAYRKKSEIEWLDERINEIRNCWKKN